MDKKNNIYNYKAPKSMNEETHFFLARGRIGRKTFWLRWLLAMIIYCSVLAIYFLYALPKFEEKLRVNDIGEYVIRDSVFENTFTVFRIFSFVILPLILSVFIYIQAAKRIHDTNKSGWLALVPIYNLVLMFTKGTDGNNDYGINPRKQKKVKYFDELEKDKK